MKTIFFEWQDFEDAVFKITQEDNAEYGFDPGVFSLDKAKGYEAVSIFINSVISKEDLKKLKQQGTRILSVRATGYDNLDVAYAKELGFLVYRVAVYSPESVAEHTFALLLAITKNLKLQLKKHERENNERDMMCMATMLYGKTLGIYGLGSIGKCVAQIAQGFGMKVIYYDIHERPMDNVKRVESLKDLFTKSNAVSVHVPLNQETKYSINEEVLADARKGVYLINTARGSIMEPNAVLAALDRGIISGLGVDVWDNGQMSDAFDRRLLRNNVIQTNHIAFLTQESVRSILEQTIQNLEGKAKEGNLL